MKENDVCFNAELSELANAQLQVLEEGRIEPGEIPIRQGLALEREKLRFVFVEDIVLREYAHSHLVEGRGRKRLECLLLKGFALVRPGIAGRAHGDVPRAVRVGEVIGVGDTYRSVIVLCRFAARERARPAVQFIAVARSLVAPIASLVGHKADAIQAAAIIESFGLNAPVAKAETSRHLDIRERVSSFV